MKLTSWRKGILVIAALALLVIWGLCRYIDSLVPGTDLYVEFSGWTIVLACGSYVGCIVAWLAEDWR